ncbi:MAG: septum formation initiator family protein [Gammaproteobacteria bacterium]|nr:septum formation initiator family protein [Gammaproteobacteria bacterium]MCY4218550.1 septum formation initiator family protein [Gammaproteobacteria bacterium]MCY4274510.1 septum formation initiator family protein [Gammaproteobacteria bacterium]
MKIINFSALVCVLGLAFVFLFGDNNYLELRKLESQLEKQQAENEVLKARNDKLLRQVMAFKGSDEAVEAIARSELGLIKEDEVFYQIVEIQDAEVDSF